MGEMQNLWMYPVRGHRAGRAGSQPCLQQRARDPRGEKSGACKGSWLPCNPPQSLLAILHTRWLFVLTGTENSLGVITTVSLFPDESMAVCGISWFQALLLKFGAEGRFLSDQCPCVINVGLFISGVRRQFMSEAAVVTSIWKVKSGPIGIYVWMKNSQGVCWLYCKVFSFRISRCVRVKCPASPNRCSSLPCPVFISMFLLWWLFWWLCCLLAQLRQYWIRRSAITRLTYISRLYYFNFFTWPLALAWQPSSMWMFCSGKVLREEEKIATHLECEA